MEWHQIGTALAGISTIIAIVLFTLGWLLRKSERGVLLFPLSFALLLWSQAYVFEFVSGEADQVPNLHRLSQLGSVATALTWALFALVYTDKGRWLSLPAFALALAIPALAIGVAWANNSPALPGLPHIRAAGDVPELKTAHQIILGLHALYYYGLVLVATASLVPGKLSPTRWRKPRTLAPLIGGILPWVGIASYWLDLAPDFDATPAAFAAAGLLLAWILVHTDYAPALVSALRRAIVAEIHDGILVTDPENRIVDANPAAIQLTGLPLADLLDRTPADAFVNYPTLTVVYETLAAQKDAGPRRAETELVKQDTKRGIELILAPLTNPAGHAIGNLIILHDISKYQQAQDSLSHRLEELYVLREIDASIGSSLDIDDVLETALAAAMRVSNADAGGIALLEGSVHRIVKVAGLYPQTMVDTPFPLTSGIVGRVTQHMEAELVRDVRSDPDYLPTVPSTRTQMTVPLITHESMVGVLNLETADPARFTLETFEFVKLLAGRIAGAIENAQLYTLSLKQVVELKTTYDQVRELQQLRTDMFRVASHDLKNPLNLITGYLSLLREDSHLLGEQHREYVREMLHQAERMSHIIHDILSLERLQEETIHEPTDFQAIVQAALVDTSAEAAQKSQILESDLPKETIIVNGDATQLREAVVNLIGNAIKYTPEGGHIVVKLDHLDGALVFEVTDNGYGIPEDRQRRLFQPFYRAKAAGTEDIPGTGLGLHLVKNIVQRHGGKVHYRSAFGEGSTFGFELPSRS